MSTIISVCGDCCSECPRYLATLNNSNTELERIAQLWFRLGFRDRVVSANEIKCNGCQKKPDCSYGLTNCEHLIGKENCGECKFFPCPKFNAVFKKSDLTGTTQNYVASRVMEEMLHAVITPSLLEHFNNNATEARSLYRNAGGQIPDYISNLGSLFLQANKAVRLMLDGRFGENYFTNNLNIVRQIRQNEEKGISNAEDLLPTKATDLKGNTIEGTALTDIHDLIYSVSDIYEFTARLLSNPTLISKLGNVQYSGME